MVSKMVHLQSQWKFIRVVFLKQQSQKVPVGLIYPQHEPAQPHFSLQLLHPCCSAQSTLWPQVLVLDSACGETLTKIPDILIY